MSLKIIGLKKYYIYFITNKKDGILYIGSTGRLKVRINQHKRKVHSKTFSARYNLDKLVYFEVFETKEEAFKREKQLKQWNRDWKINLINKSNPNWDDLFDSL